MKAMINKKDVYAYILLEQECIVNTNKLLGTIELISSNHFISS